MPKRTTYAKRSFTPDNIYALDDGTFVWFDGRRYIDVSDQPVWWKCPHGHEWQESIASMVGRGSGAPCCDHSDLAVEEGY